MPSEPEPGAVHGPAGKPGERPPGVASPAGETRPPTKKYHQFLKLLRKFEMRVVRFKDRVVREHPGAHAKLREAWHAKHERTVYRLYDECDSRMHDVTGLETPGNSWWAGYARLRLNTLTTNLRKFHEQMGQARRMDTFTRGALGKRYDIRRGIRSHNLFFGANFIQLIRQMLLEKKNRGDASPLRILDLSMGDGVFLKQLKGEFGSMIVAHGVTATPPKNKGTTDHVFKGDALSRKGEFQKSRSKYDLIVCLRGVTMGATTKTIRKLVLNRLNDGGMAHLDLGDEITDATLGRMYNQLRREGFHKPGLLEVDTPSAKFKRMLLVKPKGWGKEKLTPGLRHLRPEV